MGKNREDIFMDESQIEILKPQESTVEEYDMKLENLKEEVKNLKKIKKRQKKVRELEFEQREILKKMDKDYKKSK